MPPIGLPNDAALGVGVGVRLLAEDGVQADHRRLGPGNGFPDPPPSEMALVAGKPRPSGAVAELAGHLVETVGSAVR